MKILFIIPSLLCGGAEKLLVDILTNFDYEHHDVSLLTLYKNEVYGSRIPKSVKRIQPYYVDTRWYSLERRILGSRLSKKLDRIMLTRSIDSSYDCIISFLEGLSASIHQQIKSHSKKNITFVHTDLIRYPDSLSQFDMVPDVAYSSMDSIVFVSKNAKDSFEKALPEVKTNKVVLRNFIDIENVREQSQVPIIFTKSNPIIVTVGRVEPVKGFDLLVGVAIELKKRINSFKIIIVGDGSDFSRITNLIKINNLQDNIILTGFQSNPYPYVKQADIFVSTSLAEGFPLVLCEAMTLGKPIIASKTDGATELLANGCGILVDRNEHQYAEAIINLLQDKKLYSEYVNKGLENPPNLINVLIYQSCMR